MKSREANFAAKMTAPLSLGGTESKVSTAGGATGIVEQLEKFVATCRQMAHRIVLRLTRLAVDYQHAAFWCLCDH